MKSVFDALAIVMVGGVANGDIIVMDQIGSMDGSAVTDAYFVSQDFEASYDIYDVVSIENYNGHNELITTVEMVLGGWNGFIDPSVVLGYAVNLYSSPDAAGSDLIGDIASQYIDVANTIIHPDWVGAHYLIVIPTDVLAIADEQYIGVLPQNVFATNGQTGVAESLIGDGVYGYQANPGGGFGFGPWQQTESKFAYRLIGQCVEGFDCNQNGIDDCIELDDGTASDCNYNAILDVCDIASGASNDWNQNGIPDECEAFTDCNENGIDDLQDIGKGTSYDCDQNSVPDECQPDCDGDGLPDPCDNEADCDEDGIPDNCEIDCQPNGFPDDCDILYGVSEDVNNDGIPDECQDCNGNGVPDSIDLKNGTSEDVDGNGVPDECQAPVTWTVDDDGKADFGNIQEAVVAAGFFDEIVVYPGTYYTSGGISTIGKRITLRSIDPDDPAIVGSTIIEGDGECRAFNFQYNETIETVISGFTIQNFNNSCTYEGGAIWCSGASPTIKNCVFNNNTATLGNGGAISIGNNSSPIIDGCSFRNNSTSYYYYPGGAIISLESNPQISNTLFCENWPNHLIGEWTDGGGNCFAFSCIDSDEDGLPDECGTVGDGVHYVPEEYATIYEAIIVAGDFDEIVVGPGMYTECYAHAEGSDLESVIDTGGKRLWIHSSNGPETTIISADCAGAWLFGGETHDTVIEGFTFDAPSYFPARTFLSSPTFKNCVFTHGSPGVYVRGLSPEFENCAFINNNNGIEFLDYYGNPKLTNCIFSNESDDGWEGVAIYSESSYFDEIYNIEVIDSQFENMDGVGGNGGGAVIEIEGNLSLTDCLFTNNGNFGSGSVIAATAPGENSFDIEGCSFINNDCIGILLIGFPSDVSSITDSVFINNSSGGLSILGAPTLTITNTTICSNGDYQIEGLWYDGGGNTIEEVCSDDCYAADLTNDGIVDVNDLLAVLGYWGSTIPGGDVNNDGIVDVTDLLMIVGSWGPCE